MMMFFGMAAMALALIFTVINNRRLFKTVVRKNAFIQEMMDDVRDGMSQLMEYRKLCEKDNKSIIVVETGSSSYVVALSAEESKMICTVKSFTYDKDDSEDRAFAYREACELAETIRNA